MSPLSRKLLLLILVLITNSLHAQTGIEINAENGNLSVKANNISASELAVELSNTLGITVVVTGDAETRVNLDIVEEPLETALGKLSPNNMLVRDSSASEIIEVVLMMGEGQNGSQSSGSEQFLPTGSPAEEVLDENNTTVPEDNIDPSLLRDPNRSEEVRQAAGAASSDGNLPAAQLPPMYAEETPIVGEIDPTTGLPYPPQQ